MQHDNQKLFLDWINNFLTFNYMARYYNTSVGKIATKVKKGRLQYESQFGSIVFDVCNDFE